ncbi:MAG: 2'-5' RNA ligase family protein [Novosphingobium sp.]
MAAIPPARSPSAPFIVTAEMPGDVQAWADRLRRAHFPPERNHLAAHVTLFHSFAPSLREELPRYLATLAGEFAPPEAMVAGLMDLGGGTAIALRSEAMMALRNRIAETFWDMLTAQDRGGKKLHITVQNKVPRAAAVALRQELAPTLEPRRFAFTGLGLHLYCNPHWERVAIWPFRGQTRP